MLKKTLIYKGFYAFLSGHKVAIDILTYWVYNTGSKAEAGRDEVRIRFDSNNYFFGIHDS